MKYNPIVLTMLLLLAGGAASSSSRAAEPRGASAENADAAAAKAGAQAQKAAGQTEKAAAQADKAAADADPAAAEADSERSDANMKEMEAQLEAARARLEAAAHEVATLSARMSMPLVRNFLAMGGDEFSRAVIGVELDPVSGPGGARIEDVSPGGPAADAGLRRGDVIVSVNGTEVKGHDPARQVARLMRHLAPDSKVKVGVLREGKSREFVVTARQGLVFRDFPGVPAPPGVPEAPDAPAIPDASFHLPDIMMFHRPLAEMELATLTPQLGRYFGSDKGVLVVRAPKESGFKLQDGDVILAIDGREPTSGSHATRILGSYQPGENISLRLMRDHKVITVETTLPEHERPQRKVRILHEEAPA